MSLFRIKSADQNPIFWSSGNPPPRASIPAKTLLKRQDSAGAQQIALARVQTHQGAENPQ